VQCYGHQSLFGSALALTMVSLETQESSGEVSEIQVNSATPTPDASFLYGGGAPYQPPATPENKIAVDAPNPQDGVPFLGPDGQVFERTGADELAPAAPLQKQGSQVMFEFANTEAIKERVRKAKGAAAKPIYDVKDHYKETGCFQAIAKHQWFENVTLSIIVFNALWISIDTDGNTAATILDAKPLYIAADIMFIAYFSLELFIRFIAFRFKTDCCKDGWFVFDSTLVALYWFDPFIIGLITAMTGGGGMNLPTAVLRLFRLARLSRLVRMLRSLPELMIMIKGMFSAAASVGYTLGLLMLITYVFAIAIRNLVPVDPAEESIETMFFSTMPETMHHLLIYAVFLDALSDFVINIKVQSTPCFILTWMYVCIASMTVLNMLIGVLCEVISAVAEEEKESMMVDKVNEKFFSIVRDLDKDNDGTLSWTEFEDIMEMPEAIKALESVNVDPAVMVDMAEDVFWDDQGQEPGQPVAVTFPEFMDMVLNLRGGQQATVENIMSLAKRFNRKFLVLKNRLDTTTDKISGMNDSVDKLMEIKGIRPPPAQTVST